MFVELLDKWAIERAENMMLLPSDNTREWLEDFAAWLDNQSAQQVRAVDWAKPGAEKTVIATFVNGELVDKRELPPSH